MRTRTTSSGVMKSEVRMAPEHAAAEVSSHVMRGGSDADDKPPPSDIRTCAMESKLRQENPCSFPKANTRQCLRDNKKT